MTKNVTIGAFVLGGLALFVGAIALIGAGRLFRKTHSFVSYFDGSVNGLRAGAAVKFKGVELGNVDRIRIPFRVVKTDQPIAVFYSLDVDKLGDRGRNSDSYADTLRGAIQNGLRAQLEADSLLTGILHVSLTFTNEKDALVHDAVDGAMEIPTIPPPLQEVGSAVRTILDKIGQWDFDKLFVSLHGALDAIAGLARTPEIKSALASLDRTLNSVDATMSTLEKEIVPLARSFQAAASSIGEAGDDLRGGMTSVKATMESVQHFTTRIGDEVQPLLASLKASSDSLQTLSLELGRTLDTTRMLLDPEAPIAIELRAALRELDETARSTRALFDFLERNPAALLRGRSFEGDQPR